MTTAGIESATFQFVAQHLNRYATAIPKIVTYGMSNFAVIGESS